MTSKWETVRLGDLCELTKGASPTLKTPPGDYPLVVTGSERRTSETYQFDGEAVCIPMVSSTGHGHASLKRVHYESGRFAVANIIVAAEVLNKELCDTKYLFHYLQCFKDDLIVPLMKGTANVSLSQKALATVPIALPPLPEQRRIVDLIGALDDAIEAAEEQEQLAGELLENLQGDWPAGEKVRLGSVLTDIVGGVSAKPSDEHDGTNSIGVLKVSAVRSARFQPTEIKRLGSLSMPARAKVHNGDLLMTRSNTPSTVGQVCIADNVQENCYLPDLIWRLEVNQGAVTPAYLSHFLSSTKMRSAITGVARGTSPSMRKVNKQSVASLTIILPTLETQRTYADLCDTASKTLASYRAKADSLRSLRTELLTALLSGAHEVPESYDSVMEPLGA